MAKRHQLIPSLIWMLLIANIKNKAKFKSFFFSALLLVLVFSLFLLLSYFPLNSVQNDKKKYRYTMQQSTIHLQAFKKCKDKRKESTETVLSREIVEIIIFNMFRVI